ncbi:hypothetical protein DID88_007660 [Monilinia fructigena]|uniref:Uncharacterized protein n=1 Tax=Monilinia fructigena TaxID=38457 RepID=A0A395J416_9HELO|nr:hypothetical protein DID88_007660 [Monilinia fructigena]
MRCVWNKEVIIEEEAHRGRHERDECHCEIIFDRDERERRVKEREFLVAEGNVGAGERDFNGQARQRGRGRARGTIGNAGGVNGKGTTDKGADKNGGGGREGKSKQVEEGGSDNGMMRGWNGGFMMSAAPSGYPSPRPNDPASFHPYFEYANNRYMGAGQLNTNGHGKTLTMNPVTGVMPGIPISSPPPVTSTSEWHEDMMIIPHSTQMNSFGAYPMATLQDSFQMPALPPLPPAGPPSPQNTNMAPTCTYVYQGNHYTWIPNQELNAAVMDHGEASSQQDAQPPTQTGFTDQFSYQNQQHINDDVQHNAYNYVRYYTDRPVDQPNTNGSPNSHPRAAVPMNNLQTIGSSMLTPKLPEISGPVAGTGTILRYSDYSLPPLPPGIPYFEASTTPPAAPRYFIGSAAVSRYNTCNTRQNVVQGSGTSQSVGQINMQAPTVITTSMAPKDIQTTQATNQGRAPMRYDAKGQATTQGQSRIKFEDTHVTINPSILNTPRVISSIPRPKSTI